MTLRSRPRIDAMEDGPLARADYSLATGTHGREPRLAALRAFYDEQSVPGSPGEPIPVT